MPVPVLAADQLLIRVKATSVNPADCKQRSGNLQLVVRHTFPVAFGQDFAGTVESAPPLSSFKVGDEVFGCTAPRNGCGAEFVAVYERECAPKPASLDWETAAASPTAACTAYRGVVTLGKARAGMRVLIHGASGGVGAAQVQIAMALGCSVWGTCSPKNAEYVRSLGAEPVDYSRPLEASLRDHDAPFTPFDLILDTVGGDEIYHASRSLLAPSAKYISAVGPVIHGGSERITVGTLLWTARKLTPRLLWPRSQYVLFLSFDAADLREPELRGLLEGGKLRVRADPQQFELRDLAAAHTKCESNHSDGRIVVRVA